MTCSKSIWIYLFCSLLSIYAAAQESHSDSLSSKISYGFYVSLDQCSRNYKTDVQEPFSTSNFNNTAERVGGGFKVGIDMYYRLKRGSWLESGLTYATNTYHTDKLDVTINGVSRTTGNDTTYLTDIKNDYRLLYLYIPLKYRMLLKSSETFKYFLSAGTGVMVVLEEQTERSFINDQALQYHRFNGWWDVSIGVSFKLSNELDIKLEPGVSGTLHSVLKSPSKGFLLTTGIKAGVLYRL